MSNNQMIRHLSKYPPNHFDQEAFVLSSSHSVSCSIRKHNLEKQIINNSLIHKNTLAQVLYEVSYELDSKSEGEFYPIILVLKPFVINGFEQTGLYKLDYDKEIFHYCSGLEKDVLRNIMIHQEQNKITSGLGIGYYSPKNMVDPIDKIIYFSKKVNYYLNLHGEIKEKTLPADFTKNNQKEQLFLPPICFIQWLYPND
ncbi:hypothetical protein WAK64_10800 [Bacillus spongiae]|uniref:Uncharacterized protein n=1 Tax=Bacillus spongiae TaxID=2683610 RepID=A0ABU8HE23_9BACI